MGNEKDNMYADATTRKMVVSAIDQDCLILEEPETGHQISWPLDKIPLPLKLGNELHVTLESSSQNEIVSGTKSPETNLTKLNKDTPKEDQMRRLLEDLVN